MYAIWASVPALGCGYDAFDTVAAVVFVAVSIGTVGVAYVVSTGSGDDDVVGAGMVVASVGTTPLPPHAETAPVSVLAVLLCS